MSNVDTAAELAKIRRATFFVRGRLRLARAIGITPVVVPITVLLLAVILAAHKVDPLWLPALAALAGSTIVVAGAVVVWLVALLWPLPPNVGPLLLDKAHHLDGRLTNALEFASIPKAERTPLMQAAIDEACSYVAERPRARTLKAGIAAPLFGGLVMSWWMFLALVTPAAGMLALVVAFEIRVPAPEATVPPTPPTPPELVTADDLDAMRDAARELAKREQSPEMKAALDRFNRLIEDIAEKKLDRNEALREMEALEREMLAGSEEDDKKLADELKESAKQLDKSDLAKDLADSLKKNDLKKAEKNLKDLAKKLRENCVDADLVAEKDVVTLLDLIRLALLVPSDDLAFRGGLREIFASIFDPKDKAPIVKGKPCPKKPTKEQLKKLQDALKKAVEKRKEALAAVNEKRAEMQEQLLKKKKQIAEEKDPQKKEEQEQLLKKQERELQRLDRESAKQTAANRQLEKLDRELSQAAQDLMKDLGISPEDLQKAAEALEQAAEEMNRMDQETMTEKQKEELKKKLEELREIIRQQKGDKKRQSRMVKFSKRARGGQSKAGKQGEQGEDGEDGDGEEEGEDGKDGKGKKGKGQGDGEEGEDGPGGKGKKGKKGKGPGDGDGDLEITIGPGGAPIPIPGQGGPGDKPGDGSGKGGKDAGTGAGGPVAGDPTNGKYGTNDVHQEGQETNQGPTDSQIISAAAEKGFRGNDYKKAFTDYRTHAEENINREGIPDGYRAYLRRYFQLIRPRD
jgi:hypothetical protein